MYQLLENTIMSIFSIVLIISLGIYSSEADCGTILFRTNVANQSFSRQKLPIPPADRLELNYTLTFRKETCCPIVVFENDISLDHGHLDTERLCYKEKNFDAVVPYSHFYIYGVHWLPRSGCNVINETYICKGTRRFFTGTPTNRWMDIGYKCNKKKQLDINVELQLKCTFPVIPEEMTLDYCKTRLGYNKTILPNAIGQTSQVEANQLFVIILGPLGREVVCYQYIVEFICYTFYPRSNNRGPYLPCKKSCEEGVVACADYLNRFGQPLYCGEFPDTLDQDVCFYKPIQCPELEKPKSGIMVQRGHSLFNTTEYSCPVGYKLQGNATRHCTYDGKWNGTAPVCVPHNNLWVVAGPIIGVFILCIVIAVSVTCAYRRDKICDFIKYYDFGRRNFYHVNQGQKTLFLTYSSEDRERVEDHVLPRSKQELPGWNILTYQENVIGGDSLIKSIEKGIWESHAVLALLTPNYIQSEYCKYEFREAQTRSIRDEHFKFIVIFDEGYGMETLYSDMPVSMSTWLQTRLYVTIGEYRFWEKLRMGLSKTT